MWISSNFLEKKSAYKVCLQRNQIEVGKLCCKHVQHMNILSWTVHIMCWIRPQASSLLHLCTSVYNVHYTCTLSQQTSSSWISLTNNTQTLSKENNWNISLSLYKRMYSVQSASMMCTQPAIKKVRPNQWPSLGRLGNRSHSQTDSLKPKVRSRVASL